MTEQDLADRLEKAIEVIVENRADWLVDAVAAATQNRMFLRDDPAADVVAIEAIYLNGAKAIRTALASLPRSAPASGEMREAVLAEIAALVRGVVYAEHYRAWPTLEVENRRNTDRVTVQCDVLADAIYALRTPSGETHEEAGS